MISSIGSSNYNMGQMPAMGSRPDPSAMFSNADEDGNGSLDETEAEQLADMIGGTTDEDVDVQDLMADYDEDGDGLLSEDETETALEANRPQGPPPGGPPPGGMMGPGGGPSQMFSDADEDEDDSLDETEAETIAEMISSATDEDVSVQDLMAEFDEDEDGLLSEEETETALEANRPEGSPPPDDGGAETSWPTSAGIESYMKMAAMGQDPASTTGAILGGNNAPSFSTENFSLNTRV